MISKQRIDTALSGEQPDRIPIFELYINASSIVKLAKLMSSEPVEAVGEESGIGDEPFQILDLYCFIIKTLGIDATCSNFSMGLKNIGNDCVQDKYGNVFQLSKHGGLIPLEGAVRTASDVRGLDLASKLTPDDFNRVRYIIENVGQDKTHFLSIKDPFKISWRLRGGMQNLLMDYALNPRLVLDLARISTELNMAVIDMAIDVGVNAIVMDGDLAGEQGMIMSPEHYRKYIRPSHAKTIEYAHAKGLKVVKHSDGNIWPILDDFVEVGFDGIHPIQPPCMDIAEVKDYLGTRICILGNIDCRELLSYGTEAQVEEAVKATIQKASPNGGFIISSSNSIHPGVKPENYIAMVKASHEHGTYS